MSKNRVQCEEQVSDGGAWPRFHQCTRMAVNEEGGKHYCKQHTPSIARAKANERYRQHVAKIDARHAAARRPLKELEDAVAQRDARVAELEAVLRATLNAGYDGPLPEHVRERAAAALAASKSAMQGQTEAGAVETSVK